MSKIINPILPGFNPDPSILRVGDDYYIATSTFEWFPGVQIHHSRDLINWRLLTRPLNRLSQLNMIGNPISCGIWAPCLTYDKGTYYLVYTDVKSFMSNYKDTHNYLVTTNDITGDWSDPIYLNSSGFDPSLFHDDDGRKWLVGMQWDHRVMPAGKSRHKYLIIQEYSVAEKRLVGPITKIYDGTTLRTIEAPHIYKKDGWYYVMCAEGGTWHDHAVTVARSRNILGAYETDPENPMLTSADDPLNPLQKSGHASIVETQKGDWYMVHLCGRPIPNKGRCTLGRETSIQKIKWEDGWIRLAHGGHNPKLEVEGPGLEEQPWNIEPSRDDFDNDKLNINWQTLRIPLGEDILTLKERPGYLRLYGRESLRSHHTQALAARRWQAFKFRAQTCVEFEPETYQQMAGLVCLYDTENYYYLRVSLNDNMEKVLGIMKAENNAYSEPVGGTSEINITGWERIHLRVEVRYDRMQFFYSRDGVEWNKVGGILDASTLSDETCKNGLFTGAFVGLCCQDLSGRRKPADFDYFEYIEG
jgi:xylan 1,4-beta-xylosidase